MQEFTLKSFEGYIAEFMAKSTTPSKNAKQFLTLSRHVCMCPTETLETEEFTGTLITIVNILADNDVERKILRTCYYLLVEILMKTKAASSKIFRRDQLQQILFREITESSPVVRFCLGWRLIGILFPLSVINEESFLNEFYSKVASLRYPEKQKKVLLGQKKLDREHRNQLETWCSYLSCYRRMDILVKAETFENVLLACTSSHISLARHGLALVAQAVEKNPSGISPLFMSKIHSSYLVTSDTMCCQYVLCICHSLVSSSSTSAKDVEELKNYMLGFVNDKRLKISLEAARWMGEFWGFREAMELAGNNKGSCLVLVVGSLERHLSEAAAGLASSDEATRMACAFNLVPICRSCCRLGKVLVMRPRLSGSDMLSGDTASDEIADIVRPIGLILAELIKTVAALLPVSHQTHLLCEALKAFIWVLPDAKGTTDEHASTWTWLQKQINQWQLELGEQLVTSLLRQVLARIDATPFYSAPAIELALTIAETALWTFLTDGTSSSLISVWGSIIPPKSEGRGIDSHAKLAWLTSVSNTLDKSPLYPVTVSGTRGVGALDERSEGEDGSHKSPSSPLANDESPTSACAVVHRLKLHSFQTLAENAHIWLETSTSCSLGEYQNVLFDVIHQRVAGGEPLDPNGVPLFNAILMRLIQGLWLEGEAARSVCAEGLTKIAFRTSSNRGLCRLIVDELTAVAAQYGQNSDGIQLLVLALKLKLEQSISGVNQAISKAGVDEMRLRQLLRQIDTHFS